jgi:PBP1b-binding outer membrane lipoprotein LpoB
MKTYLMSLLAAAMMLTGATTYAAGNEEGGTTHSSSTSKLEVTELKPVAEEAPAAHEPMLKPAKQYKRSTSNKQRSKDLDFRHCLELEDNAAIAKCAQEQ